MSYAICLLRWECLKKVRGRTGSANDADSARGILCKRHFIQTDGAYFIRLGNGLVLRWCWEEDEWNKSRTELPSGARQIDFADLPEALREEVLAVLARAAAVSR